MLNILLITADDMSYMSTGVAGCEFSNITPNIDGLSRTGYHFCNAHTTIGLCQPARSVYMTGLYPWNNGAFGFEPVFEDVITLPEILKSIGYTTGIVGKVGHLSPSEKFPWDFKKQTDWGFNSFESKKEEPKSYLKICDDFFRENKNGPFFFMVNSNNPHRNFPKKPLFNPDDVIVPEFLVNDSNTRHELACYYTSVKTCDDTVGAVLSSLKKYGLHEKTLVIFTSDHGMAFPYMKANCYQFSTKVPLIFNLPGHVKEVVDDSHFVSGVDLTPTILDLVGFKGFRNFSNKFDGKSYVDLLSGGSQEGRGYVLTCLMKNWGGGDFQIRSIQTKSFCYMRNFWSDGKAEFHEDGCLSNQKAFKSLPEHDKHYIRCRKPEELYDISNNFYSMNDVSKENQEILLKYREVLLRLADKYGDKKSTRKSVFIDR